MSSFGAKHKCIVQAVKYKLCDFSDCIQVKNALKTGIAQCKDEQSSLR